MKNSSSLDQSVHSTSRQYLCYFVSLKDSKCHTHRAIKYPESYGKARNEVHGNMFLNRREPFHPLVLHDRIPRQIHLTRDTESSKKPGAGGQRQRVEADGVSSRPHGPPPILRFEQTSRLRGKTHDELTFALPAAELTLRQGVATLRVRTTTVSFVRYAPPVDQSSAIPGYPGSRDFSIGRVPTRTRSKATRPGQLTHIRPPL